MLFMVNMSVMMLVLDCLLCVSGVRVQDTSLFRNCLATVADCYDMFIGEELVLTGTLPTEIGLLTSLTQMYASCHPPSCVSR
jgi:hypothetical protein